MLGRILECRIDLAGGCGGEGETRVVGSVKSGLVRNGRQCQNGRMCGFTRLRRRARFAI